MKDLQHKIAVCFGEHLKPSIEYWKGKGAWKRFLLEEAECEPDHSCANDYVDANMSMAAAFQEITGREPDVSSQPDTDLWNESWSTFTLMVRNGEVKP